MLNEFRSDSSDSLIGFTRLQSIFQNISHQLCKIHQESDQKHSETDAFAQHPSQHL